MHEFSVHSRNITASPDEQLWHVLRNTMYMFLIFVTILVLLSAVKVLPCRADARS